MTKRKGNLIAPADFSDWMNSLLDAYDAEVVSITVETVDGVSRKAKEKLRSKSCGEFEDRTGSYRRGWRAELRKTNVGVLATVYNVTDYRLTHLLEFGHQMRNGERSNKYPHIADVNDWAIEQFELELARGIEEKAAAKV